MRISDWSSDVCSSDLDGQRTLAQLIAADARARLIAPLLWQRFATRLHEVPADGEVFPLVEIGAHCRGSLFLDASTLTSAKLTTAIGRLLRLFPASTSVASHSAAHRRPRPAPPTTHAP